MLKVKIKRLILSLEFGKQFSTSPNGNGKIEVTSWKDLKGGLMLKNSEEKLI